MRSLPESVLPELNHVLTASSIDTLTDPAFGVGVTVSLIGKDLARLKELERKVRPWP